MGNCLLIGPCWAGNCHLADCPQPATLLCHHRGLTAAVQKRPCWNALPPIIGNPARLSIGKSWKRRFFPIRKRLTWEVLTPRPVSQPRVASQPRASASSGTNHQPTYVPTYPRVSRLTCQFTSQLECTSPVDATHFTGLRGSPSSPPNPQIPRGFPAHPRLPESCRLSCGCT